MCQTDQDEFNYLLNINRSTYATKMGLTCLSESNWSLCDFHFKQRLSAYGLQSMSRVEMFTVSGEMAFLKPWPFTTG